MDNSELYAAIFATIFATIDSLKAAQERQAVALERIADSLAGVEQAITTAQFIETTDEPSDPMRTMDSPPTAIVPPRVL